MAGNEFVEGWVLGQTLGEGAYGEVKLVVNSSTDEAVAMKIIDLRKHTDAALLVKKETAIQRSLRHPHLLQYYGKRSHGHFEYIFLEYCSGGELFDRIEPDVGMPVSDARRYFLQILSGVEYLHSRGVTHRDLKPENLLLDEHDNIKISDFGMATIFRLKGVERLLERRCGTLPYVAPEVLVGPYNAAPADLWSCGIILVAMLVGELPWDQPSAQCEEYLSWCEGCVAGSGPWRSMGPVLLSLLRRVLHPQPPRRLVLQAIREHSWLRDQDVVTVSGSRNVEVCLSQPLPLPTGPCASSLVEKDAVAVQELLCFSQPAVSENLLLASQLTATQCSQGMFQRFVRRMTRFSVNCDCEKATGRLQNILQGMQCQWKAPQGKEVTITTTDSRKMQLVFKANFIDMDQKLLIDFRLSKGCGLEFKRRFVQIRNAFKDLIAKS